MKTESPVIEKLRKMIAHEQSARSIGNQAEAEAFAAKIQEMLDAHKLSMSEVDIREREENEPVNEDVIDWANITGKRKVVKSYWHLAISKAVAEANDCARVGQQGANYLFYFVGRTSDREIAKILYVYFIGLGEHLCEKSEKENRTDQLKKFAETNHITHLNIIPLVPALAKGFRAWMKNYRNSWLAGFGEHVATRLRLRHAQTEAAAEAIVHIKRDALAVQEFLKNAGPMKRVKVGPNIKNIDGMRAGQSTGDAVNLSPGTFSGATGRASRLLGS